MKHGCGQERGKDGREEHEVGLPMHHMGNIGDPVGGALVFVQGGVLPQLHSSRHVHEENVRQQLVWPHVSWDHKSVEQDISTQPVLKSDL